MPKFFKNSTQLTAETKTTAETKQHNPTPLTRPPPTIQTPPKAQQTMQQQQQQQQQPQQQKQQAVVQDKRDSREKLPFDSPGLGPDMETRYSRPFGYGVDITDLKRPSEQKTIEEAPQPSETEIPNGFLKTWHIVKSLGLNDSEITELKQYIRYLEAKDRDCIVKHGNTARSECFFVCEGELEAEFTVDGGTQAGSRLLKKGDYFGELALTIEVLPRGYTVVSKGKSKLFGMCFRGLQDFLNKEGRAEDIKAKYLEYKRHHVTALLGQLNVDFFTHVPANRLLSLFDDAELTEILPGETYCLATDPAHTFDMVLDGDLQVREGPELLPGHHFSEVALASVIPRPVTITASSRTLVLSLYGVDFAGLFSDKPQVYANLAMQLAREHTPLLPILIHPMGKAYFTNFLESCWSERHVKFFDAVHVFKKMVGEEPQVMLKEANVINDQFLASDGVYQVNITANTRSKIQFILQKSVDNPDKYLSRITPQLFGAAMEEVMGLLSFDFLPLFKAKEEYQILMTAVGKYKYPGTTTTLSNGFRIHGEGSKKSDFFSVDRQRLQARLKV